MVLHEAEEGLLGKYSFGSGVLAKTFCKRCGVNLTNSGIDMSEDELAALSDDYRYRWNRMTRQVNGLNMRVINGIDIKDIKEPTRQEVGKNWPPLYVYP